MRSFIYLAAACLVLTLATLAAPAPALAQDVEMTLIIKNHRFEPTELRVPAGKRIKLTVKNLDPTAEEFESLDLRREKIVAGNSEITVYIGPLKPGTYGFFGDFNQDTAQGKVIAE